MQQLGIHHPALTLALQPEFLCVHRYFDTPEPDMDDPACILDKNRQIRLCIFITFIVKKMSEENIA